MGRVKKSKPSDASVPLDPGIKLGEPMPPEALAPKQIDTSAPVDVGGLEAAKRALTGEPAPQPAPTGPKPPPAPDYVQGAALVAFTEQMTPVIVRLTAATMKVPMTPELEAAAKLTEDEKKSLSLTAPVCAPLVMAMIAQSDKIALGVYVITFAATLAGRFGKIKEVKNESAKRSADVSGAPKPAA